MTFYVDVIVCDTVKQKIVCDGASFIADDHYVFQDGEVDERAQTSPMGTSTGNVSNPASGIRKHVVFDIGGEERNIGGKWAETDAVELLA
jgi:hypothetical protein